MIETLVDSLNTLLSHHPALLHLMQVLFWVKYWALLAIMGGFIFLAYSHNGAEPADEDQARPAEARGVFFA